jgi:hypothetical protein
MPYATLGYIGRVTSKTYGPAARDICESWVQAELQRERTRPLEQQTINGPWHIWEDWQAEKMGLKATD